MLHPSTKRLIDKLSDMTRKQRVAWMEGDDGSITHDTEGYRVILTPEPHAVFLTDVLGRQIETCTPDEFADDRDDQGRPYAQFVAELFREAHRHARGTEKAIRTLLETLDAADIAPVPLPVVTGPLPGDAAIRVDEQTEDLIDEMAPLEGEQAMAEAVATLAEQINSAEAALPDERPVEAPAEVLAEVITPPGPVVEPETPRPDDVPAPTAETMPPSEAAPAEPSPCEPVAAYTGGFFGAYGGVGQYTGPPQDAAPGPEPAAAETVQTPAAAPPPRISLSSIPYGFGLGTLNRPPASDPAPVAPVEPAPDTPAAAVKLIDGTIDLPDELPAASADWIVKTANGEEDPAGIFPQPTLSSPEHDTPPGDGHPAGPGPMPARRFNPWN